MKIRTGHFCKTIIAMLSLLAVGLASLRADHAPPCGNNNMGGTTGKDNENNTPGAGDPFNPYTANEYRNIDDLKIWGGVGEHQLVFGRWANSRFVSGANYLGTSHSWRHTYQWDIADAGTASSPRIEIIYPDGSDYIFGPTHSDLNWWKSSLGSTDLIHRVGTDYYVQRKNGWVYHFAKYLNPDGTTYYLMLDFKDSQQNNYKLTYNAAHEVVKVTEPGGRFLTINYTVTNVNKVDFTTLARITVNPPNSQYTTLTVTDPKAYRYLRYLGADHGYDDVAEVQFYDKAGNLITGTPFGSAPAASVGHDFTKAFDGDTTTYVDDAQTSGGFCGIDLGAGKTAVVGSVRFYPRVGYANRMFSGNGWQASGYGQFQGSNQAPMTIDTISSVSTNDGRTVTYNYTPFNDPTIPYVYQNLSSVSYDDGTTAQYTYTQVLASTRPLITAYYDPRYALPFKKSKTVYFNIQVTALGQIMEQLNYDTGEVITSLSSSTTTTPNVTTGDGAMSVYNIRHNDGSFISLTNGLGKTFTLGYDGNDFKNSITDELGRVALITNSGYANPLQLTLPGGGIRKWTRDSLDLVLTQTDELGRVTTYTRDALHRPVKISYPDGSSESFTYNSFGEVLTHTLKNGGIESSVYDATGLKTSATDALGNVTKFTYDSAGRLASQTDALQHTTSYSYNGKGQVVLMTNADGTTHSFQYDTFGNKVADTDELGHTSTYAYDTFNRMISATDPLNRKTQYVYRSGFYVENKPDKVILPSGKIVTNVYDLARNLVSQTFGFGTVDAATTKWSYDGVHNILTTTDPLNRVWTFTYDVRNRESTSTDPLQRITKWTYDAVGNALTVTRQDNGVITNTYDPMNRLLTTVDAKLETTTKHYDVSGNLVSLVDAKGATYTYAYDLLNRQLSLLYPDASKESMTYSPVGCIATVTTRSGQVKTSTYDVRNRELTYTWSDTTPGVSRTYDLAGKVLTLNNGISALSYVYDAANQIVSETESITALAHSQVLSYSYDLDGNKLSLTEPDATVTNYSYTNRNQVGSIAQGGTAVVQYTYDLAGNRITRNLENSANTSYAYDLRNELTSLSIKSTSTPVIASYAYAYDVMGRRTAVTHEDGTTDNYSYDAIDQVASAQYGVSTSQTAGTRTVGYNWDGVGSRTSVTDTAATTTSYSVNSLNQYTSSAGASPVTYGYDRNGNLTSGGGVYLYDAQNRMISAQVGGKTVSFAYDAQNRCVTRTTNGVTKYLVYDQWDLVEERDATNKELVRYTHGAQTDELLYKVDSANSVAYFHQDGLGSTVGLTDGTGNILEKYSYDVFGKPAIKNASGQSIAASAYGNRFLFTGREFLAEINLYDYRNRMYSSDLGRFLQTDPLRFAAGDINIYRYAGNNATNLTDAFGLCDDADGDESNPFGLSNPGLFDGPTGGMGSGPANNPGIGARG